jgi:hypothetical protein
MRRNRKAQGVSPGKRASAELPRSRPRVWSRRRSSTNDELSSGCDPGLTPWALLSRPVDPDICLTAPLGAAEKNRARGFAPITKVYRIEAKTWPVGDTAGASAARKPPAMFRQQDERSGCSSAEPYPLACQCRLSARDCSRQARCFSRRSSIARYSFTRGKPHPRA